MGSAVLFVLSAMLVCVTICEAQSNLNPDSQVGFCTNKCQPSSPNSTLDSTMGDWLLIYSSDIAFRKGSSVWGGDLSYDYCDMMNLNKGCMATGFTFLDAKDNKQYGYTYSYNAFTDVWTMVQFINTIYKNPNNTYAGYRVTYTHYVQVADADLFKDKKPTACGTKILRSGPIYRSSNYVILANAPDYSWAVLLYCDSFYGFFIDTPLLQIVIKKSILDQISYPVSTLPFYNELKEVIQKNEFNLFASDLNLMYHDDNGNYPTSISWDSVEWEADCVCKST